MRFILRGLAVLFVFPLAHCLGWLLGKSDRAIREARVIVEQGRNEARIEKQLERWRR